MKRFVSLNKRSKKEQKAYHQKQRGSWHEVNPVTRIIPSGKEYHRSREKSQLRTELSR